MTVGTEEYSRTAMTNDGSDLITTELLSARASFIHSDFRVVGIHPGTTRVVHESSLNVIAYVSVPVGGVAHL